MLGPSGLSMIISKTSNKLDKLETGYLYHYTFLILIGSTLLLGIRQFWITFGASVDYRIGIIFFIFSFFGVYKSFSSNTDKLKKTKKYYFKFKYIPLKEDFLSSFKKLPVLIWIALVSIAALFFIGNSYLSIILVLGMLFYYCYNYITKITHSSFFLCINLFFLFCFAAVNFDPIIGLLFSIKILLIILIINTFISIFITNNYSLPKDTLRILGLYLLLFCLFLLVVKLYFLNTLHQFAIESISTSLYREGFVPSKSYFVIKNWSFLTQPANSFVLDFSDEGQIDKLDLLIGSSPTSKWLFYFVYEMVVLNISTVNLAIVVY